MQKINVLYSYHKLENGGKRRSQNIFKWKHFESEIIILCIRWYLKYPLSYRMLVDMMEERGLNITHTTIMRWVHQYSPIIDERVRKHIKPTNDSWRMDETYLKIVIKIPRRISSKKL